MSTRKKKPLPKGRGVGVLFGGIGVPRTETASLRARMVSSVAHDVFPFLIDDRPLDPREPAPDPAYVTRRAFSYAEAFVAERERRLAAAAAQDRKTKKK